MYKWEKGDPNARKSRLIGAVPPSVPVWAVFYDPRKLLVPELFTRPVLFYAVREMTGTVRDGSETSETFLVPIVFDSIGVVTEEVEMLPEVLGYALTDKPEVNDWLEQIEEMKKKRKDV